MTRVSYPSSHDLKLSLLDSKSSSRKHQVDTVIQKHERQRSRLYILITIDADDFPQHS